MITEKKICRNCSSKDFQKIQHGAILQPFFAYRAFGITQTGINLFSKKYKIINFLTFGLAEKIFSKANIYLDSGICGTCNFFSTWNEIPYENLSNIYRDYRSDSYDRDRERFEPGYIQNIGSKIGKNYEINARCLSLNAYLKELQKEGFFLPEEIRKAVDWGGADGSMLPELTKDTERYVYEVSEINPIQGVKRISSLNDSHSFDYLQIAHVLEHVSNPSDFLKNCLNYLNDGGYVYIEVPFEVPNEESLNKDVQRKSFNLSVHEHINKFTILSLTKLAEVNKLKLLDVRIQNFDIGWTKGKILRFLGKKNIT